MKAHFIRLFNYDRFANQQMLKAIGSAGGPQQAVRFMAHLIASQQVWLQRCKDPGFRTGPLWPEGDIDTLSAIAEENHRRWMDYLEVLTDEDFAATIHYVNATGEPFSNLLSDIISHLINHGTHHRAQAGQQLKQAGEGKLPATDYIFYLRQ